LGASQSGVKGREKVESTEKRLTQSQRPNPFRGKIINWKTPEWGKTVNGKNPFTQGAYHDKLGNAKLIYIP
jgi:hypothetical protein